MLPAGSPTLQNLKANDMAYDGKPDRAAFSAIVSGWRAGVVVLACLLLAGGGAFSRAVAARAGSVDTVVLFPGDARTFDFDLDGTVVEGRGSHLTLIVAVAPDREIHRLTLTVAPRGDTGPGIGYFTSGVMLSFSGGFVEFIEPKFTYGFESVTYVLDVNPYASLGFLYTGAMVEFSHFDFPLEMGITTTLSN